MSKKRKTRVYTFCLYLRYVTLRYGTVRQELRERGPGEKDRKGGRKKERKERGKGTFFLVLVSIMI